MTLYFLPRYLVMVLALEGDSTMISDFDIFYGSSLMLSMSAGCFLNASLQDCLYITIPWQLFYEPLYLKTEQKMHHLLGRKAALDDDLIHMLRLQRDPFVYPPFLSGKRPVVYRAIFDSIF